MFIYLQETGFCPESHNLCGFCKIIFPTPSEINISIHRKLSHTFSYDYNFSEIFTFSDFHFSYSFSDTLLPNITSFSSAISWDSTEALPSVLFYKKSLYVAPQSLYFSENTINCLRKSGTCVRPPKKGVAPYKNGGAHPLYRAAHPSYRVAHPSYGGARPSYRTIQFLYAGALFSRFFIQSRSFGLKYSDIKTNIFYKTIP
jgi:hypothetical protein